MPAPTPSFLYIVALGSATAFALSGSPPSPPVQTMASAADITISAGANARRNTPVSFPLPGASNGAYSLSGGGKTLPVQVSDGVAWVILPELAAGATSTFQLV